MLQRKIWIFAGLALAPILAIYAAVRLYPIGETLRLSLYQWNILSKNKPFIGSDNFRELIGKEKEISRRMSRKQLERAFDLNRQLRNVDKIFARVFGKESSPQRHRGTEKAPKEKKAWHRK